MRRSSGREVERRPDGCSVASRQTSEGRDSCTELTIHPVHLSRTHGGNPNRPKVATVGLLRRVLLGSGRLPDRFRTPLEADGMVLLDEDLRGSITYRHYRAPHERSNWSKEATAGAIAISTGRLVVWVARGDYIDLPRDHPWRGEIEASVDKPGRVCLAYDAERFRDDRSGRVEIRLRTAHAPRVVDLFRGAT
jgi:hypothetical protein